MFNNLVEKINGWVFALTNIFSFHFLTAPGFLAFYYISTREYLFSSSTVRGTGTVLLAFNKIRSNIYQPLQIVLKMKEHGSLFFSGPIQLIIYTMPAFIFVILADESPASS
jgi:hypothetical protein